MQLRDKTLFALAFMAPLAQADTIRVPADQPSIQAAISAAINGDLVLVAPGVYAEEIDFLGKAITVQSEGGPGVTTINPSAVGGASSLPALRHSARRRHADGQVEVVDPKTGALTMDSIGARIKTPAGGNDGSVVLFTNNETRDAVLDGFTITGGAANFDGGGIRIEQGASPTIINNIITGNTACSGGAGIVVSASSPLIQDNVISNNQQSGCSGGSGGGVYIVGAASTELRGNWIIGNSFTFGGGVSLFAAGTPVIANNHIVANTSSNGGGGMDIVNYSDALIMQNVIRLNTGGTGNGDGVDWLVPSGRRGPLLLNNSIAHNGDREIVADGFDAAAALVGNIILANGADTAVFCADFNDTNTPIMLANNAYSPNGNAYGGICADPTGSNGNFSADPQFVDVGAGDLRLLQGSQSIDAGDTSAPDLPAQDLAGNPRIVDGDGDAEAQVDQGAYELQFDDTIFADDFEPNQSAD